MGKLLKFYLYFCVFSLVLIGGGSLLIDVYDGGGSLLIDAIEKYVAKPKLVVKTAEEMIADFQQRHDSLASLPPRSFKDGPWDHSLYPDDYYNKTQQLYREEIAFIFEQYGEDATAKVVFLISQIPVTGQYFIGKIEASDSGLRYEYAHDRYTAAFDAVCAQIAHKTINSICDYALGLAMGYGYKQTAQSIIRCYKPDILITKTKGNLTYHSDEYKVSTTYQSRDNAKARIADL